MTVAAGRAMHPELCKRMHELGIGASNDIGGNDVQPSCSHGTLTPLAAGHQSAGDGACSSSQASPHRSALIPRLRLPGSESSDVAVVNVEVNDAKAPLSEATASSPSRAKRKTKAHEDKEQHHDSDLRGLDPNVTDMLLQLEALDARSKSLQKQSAAACDVRRKVPIKERHTSPMTARNPVEAVSKALQKPSMPAGMSEAAALSAADPETDDDSLVTAAATVARQHPLQSLPLGKMAGTPSEPRWPGARGRRDNRLARGPAAASIPMTLGGGHNHLTPKAHQVLDLAPSYADAFSNAPAASTTGDPRRSKAPANVVSLPPLKPSSSAPGCLMHGSWAGAAAHGH